MDFETNHDLNNNEEQYVSSLEPSSKQGDSHKSDRQFLERKNNSGKGRKVKH